MPLGAGGVPVAEKGLVFDGIVTRVDSATSFRCPGLSGLGNAFFQGWAVYVVRKVDGTGAAPQGEGPACLTYVSLTGAFTHVAFTAPLTVGDEIYLIHPGFSALALALIGLAAEVGTGQGLCYRGIVTAVPGANQFTIQTLAGLGVNSFVDLSGINPYQAFVKTNGGGGGAAPQGEHQAITGYATLTGNFSANAFTVPIAVGDEVLIIHPFLARIMNSAGAPGTNGNLAANWNSGVGTSGQAGADLVTIGAPLTPNKLHALIVGIAALAGNVNIKLFADVNGVDTMIFPPKTTTWNIAAGDSPGVAVVNGTIGLRNALRVEVFSDLPADDAQVVSYDFLLEHM